MRHAKETKKKHLCFHEILIVIKDMTGEKISTYLLEMSKTLKWMQAWVTAVQREKINFRIISKYTKERKF